MAELAHAEDIKKHVRTYITVFAVLAGLTVVTVAVGYLHLPIVPALMVALFIALIKGGLVASYFMHLISEKRVIFLILMITVGFFVVMFVLMPWALTDQMGR
jgi:cytochrome c oxidase subunit 4